MGSYFHFDVDVKQAQSCTVGLSCNLQFNGHGQTVIEVWWWVKCGKYVAITKMGIVNLNFVDETKRSSIVVGMIARANCSAAQHRVLLCFVRSNAAMRAQRVWYISQQQGHTQIKPEFSVWHHRARSFKMVCNLGQ